MARASLFTALSIVIFASGCLSITDPVYKNNESANRLFAQGRYTDALEVYREAQVGRPELPQLDYNAGSTLHKLGELDRASRQLQRALSADSPNLQARTHYNIGNTLYMMDRYQEAIEEYKKDLRINPSDMDAKHNIEYLQRLLTERRQQDAEQQQGGSPDPSDNGEEKGDQGAGPQGQDDQPQENQSSRGDRRNSQQRQGERTAPDTSQQEIRRMLQEAGDDITIEEALRILDALRDREQEIRGSLNWDTRPGTAARQERDW